MSTGHRAPRPARQSVSEKRSPNVFPIHRHYSPRTASLLFIFRTNATAPPKQAKLSNLQALCLEVKKSHGTINPKSRETRTRNEIFGNADIVRF